MTAADDPKDKVDVESQLRRWLVPDEKPNWWAAFAKWLSKMFGRTPPSDSEPSEHP